MQVKKGASEPLDGDNYSENALQLAHKGGMYEYYRELTEQYMLPPGDYVVIPSTFQYNTEWEFMMQFYTEKEAQTM